GGVGDLEGLTLAVEGPHGDGLEALDVLELAGHRKAALVPDRGAFSADKDRVDQDDGLWGLFRIDLRALVDDHDADRGTNLGRGQSDAVLVVHGLDQVVDQLADGGVDFRDRPGLGLEAGIGPDEDLVDHRFDV